MNNTKTTSPLAGKTVKIKSSCGIYGGKEYRVEDWWLNLTGKSWQITEGNPACLDYAMRSALYDLPIDNDVLYGKIDGFGKLIHISEIEQEADAEAEISMENWFTTDIKPAHQQEVLVMMLSPDPSHEDIKIAHSMYFDGQVVQGWGDSWNEDGFLDDDLILLWKPFTYPAEAQLKAAKKAYEDRQVD